MNKSQVTPHFYIGGPQAELRYQNLEKLAAELFGGNFSKFVNEGLNKAYGLDPVTGEKVRSCPTGAPKAKSSNFTRIVKSVDKQHKTI